MTRAEKIEAALKDIGQRCAMAHAHLISQVSGGWSTDRERDERIANSFAELNKIALEALRD